jgi:beta-mannosidase
MKYLKEYGIRNLMLWLELSVDGKIISTNFVTFARPKHFELCKPDITASVSEKDGWLLVTLMAKAPALFTWLELADIDATFSDNFFHLLPGKPIQVTILPQKPVTLSEVEKQLRIRSLIDSYS